ncbi:MAG TPA: SDR family NAD(P)-dependent oxidoreductase [Streptosporangiaceae bacterium]|jgi:NAD(P)-dependent dehydrogenase (short-subunit alcohol dehydrogenase family)
MTRVALVTGAASGLGRAVAAYMADRGWTVAGLDRSADAAEGAALTLAADVRDPRAVEDAVARVAAELGGLDAVAGCAGVFHNDLTPLHLLSDDAWATHLDVNVTGAFHVVRAALPHLIAARGAIALVASVASRHPQPGGAAYAVSKAGVASLARAIALEYGPRGVRANAVSPGYMDTPMAAPLMSRPHVRAAIEHGLPLRRAGQPEEIAPVIEFLLSDAGRYVTGEDVTVDGAGALTAYTSGDDVDRMWRRNPGPG